MQEDPFSQTSSTLLGRLRRDPKDQAAWNDFVARYQPRILDWCRGWGLQESDAQDVTQAVLLRLSRSMATFVYDSSRSFRAWLKTITQHAVSDLVANRTRAMQINSIPVLESIDARADLERRIEEIFNRELLELAIAKVRARVASATWDAFRLMTFEGCSGAETSQLLGIPIASVFVAKHRVQKLLKEEIDALLRETNGQVTDTPLSQLVTEKRD